MAKQKNIDRVIIIVGPTSSGKSALAVELAIKFGGEVVSADSRQVYRGLNIGTGKVTKREMKDVRHHLLDVASAKKIFTAQEYVTRGRRVISDILARGKLPIVCGGTGFYIDALLGRLALPDVPPNLRLREKLEKKTAQQLLALLKRRDLRRAKSIDPQNKRRLIRALEINAALGKVPAAQKIMIYHNVLWIGLAVPPEELRLKINARLKQRLKSGMITEAKRLHQQGLSYKRMAELGLEYRSLARFLQKHISRDELERQLRNAIWRYAKRQMTYWRRNRDIVWLKTNSTRRLETEIKAFLKSGR